MSLFTIPPTGDGHYSGWAAEPSPPATMFDKVDEAVADDDTTKIYRTPYMASTATFTKDAYPIDPVSVKIRARGKVTNNAQYIYGLLRYGGADYLSASQVVTTAYADYEFTFPVSPFTGNQWTRNEVNSMEFGVRVTTTDFVSHVLTQVLLEVEIVDAVKEPTDSGSGSDELGITATLATVTDGGTNQQEAAGMGAVDDPRYEGPSIAAALADIPDTGSGADAIASLIASIMAVDAGAGTDAASIAATLSEILDDGAGADALILVASILPADTGAGVDAISGLVGNINVAETGTGTDDVEWVAKAYFYVTEDGILNPLGVIVLNDSRYDLLPATRENVETVPGRHGEIDFGSEFQPRLLELRVAIGEDYTRSQWDQVKRTLAKYLNPILGAKNLIFADDVEKMYKVKFAGKIDFPQLNNWLEFTIPFKASDPFIVGSYMKSQSGTGTLTNEGTFETPLTIEIAGPVTNPSVNVGGTALTYIGEVTEGSTLTIDTDAKTVKLNSANALATYTGGFPVLQAGNTAVTAASAGTTTWSWRDRWI